jgi:2'-5' RNA ligase
MKDLIKKILRENTEKVLYSAVVLDEQSHNLLLNAFKDVIPQDWKTFAHHMTIAFGKGVENPEDLGKKITLKVTELGISEMAIAARVEGYPSANAIPHITLAINPNGGKPIMSNQIKDWQPIQPKNISGVVTNITK